MNMTREQAKELFRTDKDAYGKPKHALTNVDAIYDSLQHDLQGMMLVENCMLKTTPEDIQREKYEQGYNEALQHVIERLDKQYGMKRSKRFNPVTKEEHMLQDVACDVNNALIIAGQALHLDDCQQDELEREVLGSLDFNKQKYINSLV